MIDYEIFYDRSKEVRQKLAGYLSSKDLKLGFVNIDRRGESLHFVPDGYLPVLREPVSSYRVVSQDGKAKRIEPILKALNIPYGPGSRFLEWSLQKKITSKV